MFSENIIIEISANTVAWYAALIATISVVINLLNYWRDRSKIKVSISHGFFTSNLETKIFIEAVNLGRRPVTLIGAGLSLKNGDNVWMLDQNIINFPYKLNEGEYVMAWIDESYVVGEVAKRKTEIKYAWFKDTSGKLHKKRFVIKND